MNISLLPIGILLSGSVLAVILLLLPIFIRAPKNQVTIIFFVLNCLATIGAILVAFMLLEGGHFTQIGERSLHIELIISSFLNLAPLYLRSTRVHINKNSILLCLSIIALNALILVILSTSDAAYLYMTSKITLVYLSLDPVRILFPVFWILYEISRKTKNDPSLLMEAIKLFLIFFSVFFAAWLGYWAFTFFNSTLGLQLASSGLGDYGSRYPIKFFQITLAMFLLITLDAFWVENYSLSAIEDRQKRSRILDLLIEKDQLIQNLANRNALVETGALSAGLAHELNQFLARIQLNVDEALAQISRPGVDLEGVMPYLKNTLAANQSAADLVVSLKKLFQSGRLESTSIDLDALVFDVASLYVDRAKKSNIQIKLNLQAKKSFIVWDSLMRQAIANLIANAIDALDVIDREDKIIQIQSALDAQGQYILEIADNGLGIDLAQAERLFSLFSSNKPSGTGIGLWLSSYIVQRHQGVIDFKNLPNNEGASFFITIPTAEVRDSPLV